MLNPGEHELSAKSSSLNQNGLGWTRMGKPGQHNGGFQIQHSTFRGTSPWGRYETPVQRPIPDLRLGTLGIDQSS